MSGLDGLNPLFGDKLRALIAASHGRITITSGKRSNAQQAVLYKQKPGLAAPPGKSNHEYGLAADLGGDLAFAHKMAASFGLFFPMGHEPWHIEAIGINRHTVDPNSGPMEDSYTTDPQTGMKPTEPDRHNLGVQLMSAFGSLHGPDSSALEEPGAGVLGESVDQVLGLPGSSGMDEVTGAPNASADPGAYNDVSPEDTRDTLTPEQEQVVRSTGGGVKK